jgi:rhodanese-related sulfurtransferase
MSYCHRSLPHILSLLLSVLLPWNLAIALEVNISADVSSVEVMHKGKPVTIMRNQNPDNKIADEFAKTSRKCPPFCVQPGSVAPGVETIAELEILNYLEKMSWGEAVLVIDSRTPNWVSQGTIPGSINIPWTQLNLESGANPLSIREILAEKFGVHEDDGLLNFSEAKTLVLFCNGSWCGQSPVNIQTLLQLGYPAHKIKWYRGGMQAWHELGLTTIKEGN